MIAGILIFIFFFLCHTIYLSYNMYVGKFASDLTILGISFSNYWTFSIAAVLIATPLLTLANYGFGIAFHYGYKQFDKIWLVLLLFISAQIVSSMITTYSFFQEVPSKGTLAGMILSFSGLLVAMIWK